MKNMTDRKKDISRLRNRIDKIDSKIVHLLNKRAICVDNIGLIKKQLNINVYSPKREREVLNNISAINRGPFSQRAVRKIFSCIILESRNFEHVKSQKVSRNK